MTYHSYAQRSIRPVAPIRDRDRDWHALDEHEKSSVKRWLAANDRTMLALTERVATFVRRHYNES